MPEKQVLRFEALAETQYEVDCREVPRLTCPGRPILKVTVRPSFNPLVVGVQDISPKGIGFVCDEPIEVGASLALLWTYGPPHCWRTVRARVARLNARRHNGWVVGCQFDEWLLPDDVQAFLHQEFDPELAGSDDPRFMP
jgi:hypothetical protein